ncbi:carbohydrate-binding protein [Paludibacterium sp. B53371]|uniref:carbohydrate-binding protein n=1 Tax=Paludibacterium sp. B53371 TaxID=2806263 RepID=UPI001C05007B|nr:carbohydrate-binding protein [Paludibacterium sp. B53371]
MRSKFALSALAASLASASVFAGAFSPYVDMTLWPTPQIDKIGVTQGIQQFTMAFVVSQGTCAPSWGGVLPITASAGASSDSQMSAISNGIQNFRAKGGEVALSFGGANGIPLQQSCTTTAALQSAYQTVLDAYDLSRIDFDIEGAAQNDVAANKRNFEAVAALQNNFKAKGKTLHVTLTLPTMPYGLTQSGQDVVKSALDNGVTLDGVNIMAMDYGQATSDMGAAAKQAAQGLYGQLDAAYKAHGQSLSNEQLWQLVGVTPMIGLNDTKPETFTIDNAKDLLQMASSNGIGLLGMWSLTRDKACAGNGSYVDAQCSGIVQDPYAFSSIFQAYADHWGTGVTRDPNYGGGDNGAGGNSGPVNGQPWSATQVYTAGDTVTYAGSTWTAKWWTQGDVPGQAAVWQQGGNTDNGGNTAGGNTDNGGNTAGGNTDNGGNTAGGNTDNGGNTAGGNTDNGGNTAGGNTDNGGNTAGGNTDNGGGDVTPVNGAPWSSSQIYTSGNTVSYAGADWKAQWWTQGDIPGQSSVWLQQGGGLQQWSASAAYNGGSCVMYQGKEYCAKWWTQGNLPTAGDPWAAK